MKIAYFDVIGGASGDMILGALLDCGLPVDDLQQELALLNISDFKLEVIKVTRKGFQGTKVNILVNDGVPERKLPAIIEIIDKSDLNRSIKQKSISIFNRLGTIEADIHGIPLNDIHLHELGGVDTIIDVVGTLLGFELLGIKRSYCSPIPLGRGYVNGAHGKIPLPAPATMSLLKNVPVIGSQIESELVTPTGAVLLTSLVNSFGPIPPMTPISIGYGAGTKDLPIPNLLRLIIGDETISQYSNQETLICLETNIDDMNPEFLSHTMEKLFAHGALDVWIIPIHMKKSRPGFLLKVLSEESMVEKLKMIVFSETTTLGIRQHTIQRFFLTRELKMNHTEFGSVRVKVSYLPDGSKKYSPEYEDCKLIANKHQIPIREVYEKVLWHIGEVKDQ